MNATDKFCSVLADDIRRFLAHHRALAERFNTEENALNPSSAFITEFLT